MKFGIVVCPKCKKAKVVDLSYKTSRCFRCGKILNLKKLRVLYETDSEQKARHALGLVNAKIDNKYEEFKEMMGG